MTEQKWIKPREAECVGQCTTRKDFKYKDAETGEIFYSNGKKHCSCIESEKEVA